MAETTFTPTDEQLAVKEAARNSKDNLVIYALAGAAKTSTLVLLARALSGTPITCLAFNAKIAKEMKNRLPGNCESMTLNGIGHRTWGRALGKNLVLDDDKVYRLTQHYIEAQDLDLRTTLYERMSFIMNSVRSGKTSGWIPAGSHPTAQRLLDDYEFWEGLDEEPTDADMDAIRTVTLESITEALHGIIDYNDQILMPTLFFGQFMIRPLTLVDEAQDLSLLNHVMLSKIIRQHRVIAVGDPFQAIYGFRGAHENSMDLMTQTFSMRRFDLTISFRCPIEVVKQARSRAPMMQWPDWAKDGTVTVKQKWKHTDIPDDATVLCRNNAPLFSMAIRLLRAGRYPEIVGNDIVKALIKVMEKLGPEDTKREDAYNLVDDWVATKELKVRDKNKIHDQAKGMKVFIEQGQTLGDAISYARHVQNASGPIKMMTGHRSKGLEFNDVFILDADLINKERAQDKNLLYVMQTRSMSTLTYIYSKDFEE